MLTIQSHRGAVLQSLVSSWGPWRRSCAEGAVTPGCVWGGWLVWIILQTKTNRTYRFENILEGSRSAEAETSCVGATTNSEGRYLDTAEPLIARLFGIWIGLTPKLFPIPVLNLIFSPAPPLLTECQLSAYPFYSNHVLCSFPLSSFCPRPISITAHTLPSIFK